MQAEKITQEPASAENFGGWVKIKPIAETLGLSDGDVIQIATYLESLGWAKVTLHPANPQLMLTPLGFEKIADLKRPKWKRWLESRAWWITLILSLTAIAFSLAKFIKDFFL